MATGDEKNESLSGLQRWTRSAPRDLQAEFRRISKRIGDEAADLARSRVYPAVGNRSSRGRVVRGRRRSKGEGLSATKASIKARGDRQGVSLTLGGPSSPGALGHEFGGGKRPTTRQFPVHRGRDGYFFYPTLREKATDLIKEYGEEVERLWPRPL